MLAVAQESSKIFWKNNKPVALLADEVGYRKKGNRSVGVARQYLGCKGKVDNGQVAVALTLSQGDKYLPVDMTLFLPVSWDKDQEKRTICEVPKHERHKSRPTMVMEMIKKAIKNGIHFNYLNFDALYGNSTYLLDYLQTNGIKFIADIRGNFGICFDHKREEKCTVTNYVSCLKRADFKKIKIRNLQKEQ